MATADKPRGGPTTFNFSDRECVWMKAKIVPVKYCDNAFDCTKCAFDKAMGKKLAKEETDEKWQSVMFRKGSHDLRCRHALTGGAPAYKKCANAYDCARCPYDQMLEDTLEADHTLFGPPQYMNAPGFRVPRDYYIHRNHGWARIEYGGRVRIGLDDFGNRLVGKADKFRLPSLGTRFTFAEESFIMSRESHEVGVKAPLTGVVTAVNQKLLDNPGTPNRDPYCSGWVMLIDPFELRSELKELTFGIESVKFIESEGERLLSLIADDPAAAAATGGEPIPDVYGSFKDLGWDNLVKGFL
jgi:glycine cleavage system H lipoate-binding protein